MRSALVSPQEYRAFAAQCSRWAARAKRQEHKTIMLQMAEHWTQAAQKLERAGTFDGLHRKSSELKPPRDMAEHDDERSEK
jgi:hypothetical protein